MKDAPKTKDNKRIGLLVVAAGSAFSILLISLLFFLGEKVPPPEERVQSEEITDLLNSTSPDHSNSSNIDSLDIGIALPKGGWVYQTDSMGNLAHQYRFESLDPNPGHLPSGWVEMKKPEIEVFLSGNRVVVITGDKGVANAPKRMLESGEIAGNVHISMYDLGTKKNRDNLHPSMVLTTPQVNFNNFTGEISCDNEVKIVSSSQTLEGSQLSIHFNDKENRIEYLRLEVLEYLDFYPNKDSTIRIADKTNKRETRPVVTTTKSSTQKHKISAAAIGPNPDYYLATFLDTVKIVQGDSLTGKFASGDSLSVAFSADSESASTTSVTSANKTMSVPLGINTALVSSLFATSPINQDPPIRLTCAGGLTMVPLEDNSKMPSAPEDTRIELIARENATIQVNDYEEGMSATGNLLRYELLHDRSDLFGSPATLLLNDMKTLATHLWIERDGGTGGAIGKGFATRTTPKDNSTLRWANGVDFFFDSNKKDSALEKVICNKATLEDNDSTISCNSLTINFDPSLTGSPNPTTAFASGDVKAISETQTLWSDTAEVLFKQLPGTESPDVATSSRSKAETLLANGNVQILLGDGGRVFCHNVHANIPKDTATLSGNVLIAQNQLLINKGETTKVTLDRKSGKGKWHGPGQALFLHLPFDMKPDNRIPRPSSTTTIPNHITMRAVWSEAMLLDQSSSTEANAIDLIGNVIVRSRRTKHELSKMTGEFLRLEFNAGNEPNSDKDSKLDTVIIREYGTVERRLWDKSNPSARPIVYFLGGDDITFESGTLNTTVVGNGEMIIRDERSSINELNQTPLAGRGITRFTWDERLRTTNISNNSYRMVMDGNVQMLHKSLDGTVGKLTSNQLEAITANASTAYSENSTDQALQEMDLNQIEAQGNVYIETDARSVECDIFDYNVQTGFAALEAIPHRTVAIRTTENPYPVRATKFIWNMDPSIDTITILGLKGSSPN